MEFIQECGLLKYKRDDMHTLNTVFPNNPEKCHTSSIKACKGIKHSIMRNFCFYYLLHMRVYHLYNCYLIVVTWALVVCLIYTPSALGLAPLRFQVCISGKSLLPTCAYYPEAIIIPSLNYVYYTMSCFVQPFCIT